MNKEAQAMLTQLEAMLAVRGMAAGRFAGQTVVYKTQNTQNNVGRSPQLVLAEIVDGLVKRQTALEDGIRIAVLHLKGREQYYAVINHPAQPQVCLGEMLEALVKEK